VGNAGCFSVAGVAREAAGVAMLVGVPREIKDNEYRVGIVPSTVRELADKGHQVDLLPNAILSVLYKETKVGDDVLGLRAKQQWLQASSGHLLDFPKTISERFPPALHKPLKASSRTSQKASQSCWCVTAPKRGIYGVDHGSSPLRAIAEPSARSGGSVWSFSTPGQSSH
jgi:alanine dehydrogenase/PNT-like protein